MRNVCGIANASAVSVPTFSDPRPSDSLGWMPPSRSMTCGRFQATGWNGCAVTERGSTASNDQWRICFVWTDAGPEDIEIVDCH